MAKRRYDTDFLVGRMKKERRSGIMMTLGGIVVLGALIGAYTLTSGDEPPAKAKPAAKAKKEAPPKAEAPPVEKPAEPPKEEKPPPKPSSLDIKLNKKAAVWLDGEMIGKFKKQSVELTPGEHTVYVKVGKKKVEQVINTPGDESYSLVFDVKKKKAQLKKK